MLRQLSITIFAMLVCVAFTSCAKAPANGGSTGTTAELKSVKILTASGSYPGFPVLNAAFESTDRNSSNYTAGFDYLTSVAVKSAGEQFGNGGSIVLDPEQNAEWTTVNTSIDKDCSFSVKLNLPASALYQVKAWARVGNGGVKMFSETITIDVQ